MTDNVIKFPTIKTTDFIKENLVEMIEGVKDIDIGIILLKSGDDINIFCSKYTLDMLGALELLKTKVATELMDPEEELEE